jgi:DHA2 family multidrug resistance protein-like MFS transporter
VDDHGRLHPHHSDAPSAASIGGRTRTIALGVLCLCALTIGIDMTITNVALPVIGHELQAPTDQLQWVVDGYNIVLAGLLVLGGGLADRYGRRRVFVIGYTLFGVACAMAAFSDSTERLIAARVIMGIGAAGVSAPALALIASMFPPLARSGAIGAFVVFGASGLAIGPIVGGFLLDRFWWGSVFLVDVPIVAVGVIMTMRTVPESRAPVPEGGDPPLDVTGALLSVTGLAAFLFGAIEGPTRGWASPSVLIGLVLGSLVIAAFVRHELGSRSPLFDVRILGRSAVATGSLTLLVAYILFTGFLFVQPQYLQDVAGASIVSVGLLLVPFAVVFGVCSTQAARVLTRLGPRATITLGLLTCALAATIMAFAIDRSIALMVAASATLGAGLSLLIAPPSTVLMNALPAAKAGDGSSLSMVSRFVGAALGVAVIGSVLAAIYTTDLGGSASSLSARQAATAEGSIQGALEIAGTLDRTADRSLTSAAQEAFSSGATAAYAVLAAMAALAAVWSWSGLREAPDRDRGAPLRAT